MKERKVSKEENQVYGHYFNVTKFGLTHGFGWPSVPYVEGMPLEGGQGGQAHPEFGSSVNPIPTRGAVYTLYITACPPGFENLTASLRSVHVLQPPRLAVRALLPDHPQDFISTFLHQKTC